MKTLLALALSLCLSGCIAIEIPQENGASIRYFSTKNVHAAYVKDGEKETIILSTSGLKEVAGAVSDVAKAVTIP